MLVSSLTLMQVLNDRDKYINTPNVIMKKTYKFIINIWIRFKNVAIK